jgi:hypothetical protein
LVTQQIKRQRERVERFAAGARARVEKERERRISVALAFAIADRGRRAAASVLAGALAFRLFLTALPLVLVLVVGLGYLKSAGGSTDAVLKQAGIKGVLASTINHSASFSNPGRTAVLLLGLFALFSGARTCAATLRAIHALAWGIPVARWRQGGRAGLVFLGGVAVLIAGAGLATRARTDAGVGLSLGTSVLLATISGRDLAGSVAAAPTRRGHRLAEPDPRSAGNRDRLRAASGGDHQLDRAEARQAVGAVRITRRVVRGARLAVHRRKADGCGTAAQRGGVRAQARFLRPAGAASRSAK